MPEVRVKSEIAGSVWKVLKRPGDAVEEEEPVLLLESMKMEIPVISEHDGTVSAVRVAVGDVVQEGDPLVEITA